MDVLLRRFLSICAIVLDIGDGAVPSCPLPCTPNPIDLQLANVFAIGPAPCQAPARSGLLEHRALAIPPDGQTVSSCSGTPAYHCPETATSGRAFVPDKLLGRNKEMLCECPCCVVPRSVSRPLPRWAFVPDKLIAGAQGPCSPVPCSDLRSLSCQLPCTPNPNHLVLPIAVLWELG